MKNNSISISTGHITGYGIGPISNENTLIKFVLKTGKKLKTWLSELSQKSSIKHYNKYLKEETLPISI